MIVRILKIVIPFLVLAAGVYGAWTMIESRPEVERQPPPKVVPLVRVLEAREESLQLRVDSQGTVMPRTQSELVTEISGRVNYVSPALANGAFFEKDELLLRIDSTDYELALVRAEAELAQSRLRLEQERAEAAVAREEWAELGQEEEASPLVLRKPQLAQVEAAVAAAEAALRQAERDLQRTDVRAPYDGRVRRKSVDVGQFVTRGAALAQIYSVDVAEIRLPLSTKDLEFVELPLTYRDGGREKSRTGVLIRADFAGKSFTWRGEIVRTEGEIDPETRMLYAIAQVQDPYRSREGRPPLAVGLFVEAEILGNWYRDVVSLPRAALRPDNLVYVVTSQDTLEFRSVEVLRAEDEHVLVRAGLEEGERVCVSPLETVVEGMEVRVVEEELS